MSTTRTSAPGKVMLIGEYAVLAGAPALVMAVDRRAKVSLEETASAVGRVSAPGLFPDAEFTVGSAGQLRWTGAQGRHYRILECVLSVLDDDEKTALANSGGLAVLLGSDQFYQRRPDGQRDKLGIGSSAALTVALAWGLAVLLGRAPLSDADRDNRLSVLIEAHNRFQNNPGSGADIAASLYGGSLVFRPGERPSASSLPLPSSLLLRFVWTGRPAATASYLRGLRRWRSACPQEYDRMLEGLGVITESAVQSARRGDASGFLDAAREYTEGLQRLGHAAGLDIVSAAHRAAAASAREAGVVYKPSGAGGGDLGIALSDDPDRLQRFEQKLYHQDMNCVPLHPDAFGVRADGNGRP